jgi:hypothetical protein
MSCKTTFRLFLGVCLLGCGLLLVDYHASVRQVRKSENQRIFDLSTEPVTGVSIYREGHQIECVKKGAGWFLQAPVRARGNAAAMERIVALLETAEWEDCITVEQREARELQLSDYGLDPPRATIAVDTRSRRESLFLGDATPLGAGLYARHSLSDSVLTVPVTLAQNLPATIEPLRDRAVLHGSPSQTVRFEIQRQESGFIQLVRQGSTWMIQQPLSGRADSAAVQKLLESLYALRIETFFWDASTAQRPVTTAGGTLEMAASARAESCGLAADSAQVRATVWVEGDSLGQELLLGKPDPDREGTIFAKRGEVDAIYTVSNSILDVCASEVRLLRDRTVFPVVISEIGRIVLTAGESKLALLRETARASGWQVEEPVQWDADNLGVRELSERIAALTVLSYVESPVDALADLGLAPPQFSIVLGSGTPEVSDADAEPLEILSGGGALLIGALLPGKGARYAKMSDLDEVFLLPVGQLAWLDASCVDPLLYRDRTMLALTPDHVRRVTVSSSAGEQGVTRESGRAWSCLGTGQIEPAMDAIERVLFAAANIRAVRIEAHNPKSLEGYGLDAPAATVTFGLRGEDGIQKSLLIGQADEDGRVYAVVRGQDVVFLIPATLAKLLSQPLCVPAGATPDSPSDSSASASGEDD